MKNQFIENSTVLKSQSRSMEQIYDIKTNRIVFLGLRGRPLEYGKLVNQSRQMFERIDRK